jgi:hypothetical protein
VGYREKEKTANYPYLLSLALLGLVIVQGAFGAFTCDSEVTAKYRHTAFDGWFDHCFYIDVSQVPTEAFGAWGQ